MTTYSLLIGLLVALACGGGTAAAQCAHPLGEDPCDEITDPEERELCQLGVQCTEGNAVPELGGSEARSGAALLLLGLALLTAPNRRASRRSRRALDQGEH